jgi:vacuolar-type H+-ATPase subunit H
MTAASPTPATGPLGSIDALKRVHAAELDWEQKVEAAKLAAAEDLARARGDAEAAVKAAQVAADADRAAKVQVARSDADREAIVILADGVKAADEAAQGAGKRPSDRAQAILDTVLAGFTSD